MNPIIEPILTLPVAAPVAGVSAKALRNWCDRGQILLHSVGKDERPHKWRRFSLWDCFRAAIGARLSRYGCPIDIATWAVGGAGTKAVHLLGNRKRDPVELVAAFRHVFLVAWMDAEDGGWRTKCVDSRRIPEDGWPDTVVMVDLARVAAEVVAAMEIARRAMAGETD